MVSIIVILVFVRGQQILRIKRLIERMLATLEPGEYSDVAWEILQMKSLAAFSRHKHCSGVDVSSPQNWKIG